MPTYLCHGFRWTRKLIRIFVILEDLDDAAPDWITGRDTSAVILDRFSTKFDYLPQRLPQQASEQQSEQQSGHQQEQPSKQEGKQIAHQDDDLTVPPSRVPDSEDSVLVHQSSAVKLLEEYDPEETSISARPFAYVADHVIRIDLSANVLEEIAKYEALVKERNEGSWLEKLRDELQDGASIGWYVVVNGDAERFVPEYDDEDGSESDMRETEQGKVGDEEETESQRGQQIAGSSQPRNKDRQHAPNRPTDQPHSLRHKISRAGLRRLFSKKEAPE
jgi:hypothetical protein